MKCPVCMHEVDESVKYCPYCGSRMNPKPNGNSMTGRNGSEHSGKEKNYRGIIIGMAAVLLVLLCVLGVVIYSVGKKMSNSTKTTPEVMTGVTEAAKPSDTVKMSTPTPIPTSSDIKEGGNSNPKSFVTEANIDWGKTPEEISSQYNINLTWLQDLPSGSKYNGIFTTDMGPFDGEETTVDWEFDNNNTLNTVSLQLLPVYLNQDLVAMESSELGLEPIACTIPKVDDGAQRTAWIMGDIIVTLKIPDDKTQNGVYSIRTLEGFINLSPDYCSDFLRNNGVAIAEPTAAPTPVPTAVPTQAPAKAVDTSTYIIADSNSRYVSEGELAGLSDWQLKIARNEIYARHGRTFTDRDLRNYFSGQSWYTPTVSSENFSESMLNDTERANVKTIYNYELRIGSSIADTVTP